jgi:hypothetical protein
MAIKYCLRSTVNRDIKREIDKTFRKIAWLPENVMRGIGQQIQNFGEEADENRTRAVIGGVISRTEGGSFKGQTAASWPGSRSLGLPPVSLRSILDLLPLLAQALNAIVLRDLGRHENGGAQVGPLGEKQCRRPVG